MESYEKKFKQFLNEGFAPIELSDEQKAKVIAAAKRGEAPEDVIDSDFDGDDRYLQSVLDLMDEVNSEEEERGSFGEPGDSNYFGNFI